VSDPVPMDLRGAFLLTFVGFSPSPPCCWVPYIKVLYFFTYLKFSDSEFHLVFQCMVYCYIPVLFHAIPTLPLVLFQFRADTGIYWVSLISLPPSLFSLLGGGPLLGTSVLRFEIRVSAMSPASLSLAQLQHSLSFWMQPISPLNRLLQVPGKKPNFSINK
jgi:hypothetical protein